MSFCTFIYSIYNFKKRLTLYIRSVTRSSSSHISQINEIMATINVQFNFYLIFAVIYCLGMQITTCTSIQHLQRSNRITLFSISIYSAFLSPYGYISIKLTNYGHVCFIIVPKLLNHHPRRLT